MHHMERKTTSIRMPAEMYDRLAELAQAEHRSLNGQIVALLERSLDGTLVTPRA